MGTAYTNFSLRTKVNSGIIIAGILIILVLSGLLVKRQLENEFKVLAQNDLEKTLSANAEAVLQWLENQKANAKACASNVDVHILAHKMMMHYKNLGLTNIAKTKLYLDIQARLNSYTREMGYEDYFVIHENVILCAKQMQFIGSKMDQDPKLIKMYNNGESHIMLPEVFDNELTKFDKGKPVMYAAAPIMNFGGQVISILALRISPEKTFSRVMQASKSGDTGETYAINDKGVFISRSRFDSQLKTAGLLQESQESSVLNIKAESGEGQATYAAEQALTAEHVTNYPGIGSSVEGYTNYRGKEVIGAWTYLKDYGFALITEKEIEEVYGPLATVKLIFYGLFSLAGVFAVGLIGFTIRTAAIMRQMRKLEIEAIEFGQYKLLEKLGEGGLGVVYLAEHKMMRRKTAMKLLKGDYISEDDIKLFEKEVQLSCQLKHPNTISIYDYGKTAEGIFYYVMEYLEGMDLDSHISEEGPMAAGRVAHILAQACASLNEAHKEGLIHRDIKAHNIMLCDRGGEKDFVKVLDFGLVKSVEEKNNTFSDKVCGTPAYMAPEAVTTPAMTDHRVDIYALGILGFYLLTGKYPFDDKSAVQLMMKHVKEPAPRPSSVISISIPVDLENVIMWCLEKDRSQRPDYVHTLLEAIQKCECYKQWQSRKVSYMKDFSTQDKTIIIGQKNINHTVVLDMKDLKTGRPEV